MEKGHRFVVIGVLERIFWEVFNGIRVPLLVSIQGLLLMSKWFGVGLVCRMCMETNNIFSIDRLIIIFAMRLVQVHFLRSQMIHMKVYYH